MRPFGQTRDGRVASGHCDRGGMLLDLLRSSFTTPATRRVDATGRYGSRRLLWSRVEVSELSAPFTIERHHVKAPEVTGHSWVTRRTRHPKIGPQLITLGFPHTFAFAYLNE
jgi:hypothetical protein